MNISFEEFISIKKNLKPNTPTKILTGSMAPFIYAGETIFISPIDLSKLKAGTPIVYWSNDILICHFFICTKKIDDRDYLITKGLNAKQFDSPFPTAQFLGYVSKPRINLFKRFIFNMYFKFILKFKLGAAKNL
jgi:signal peptidase I